jgi:hypothetical protein
MFTVFIYCLLFNFGLECIIKMTPRIPEGQELNRTHKLLVYTDDDVLGENTYCIV